MPTGNLSSAVIYFSLESEANEDPPASTPDSTSSQQFHTTLELNPLQSTDAGEYICQASYSLGGYISPLVRDSNS